MDKILKFGFNVGRVPRLLKTSRISLCCQCRRSYQNKNIGEERDEPIKFSTSGARDWQSVNSFAAPKRVQEMPRFQPIIVTVSTAIFLIYFCILREENEMDEDIGKSLYDRVPGLEEKQLKTAIQFERQEGRSTTMLEKRLAEIQGK